jgi:hypothetical protein
MRRRRVDIDGALASVTVASGRRQRVQVVMIGIAALLVALLVANINDIGRFLSMERRLPPAERELDDAREPDPDNLRHPDSRRALGVGTSYVREPSLGTRDPRRAASTGVAHPARTATGAGGGTMRGSDPLSRSHTEAANYQTTSDPYTNAVGCGSARVTCRVEFQAGEFDRWITVSIEDERGRPVEAIVYIDSDGDGKVEESGIEICTDTASPIAIPAGSPVHVGVTRAGCDGWPGEVSSGTVRVTFWESGPS